MQATLQYENLARSDAINTFYLRFIPQRITENQQVLEFTVHLEIFTCHTYTCTHIQTPNKWLYPLLSCTESNIAQIFKLCKGYFQACFRYHIPLPARKQKILSVLYMLLSQPCINRLFYPWTWPTARQQRLPLTKKDFAMLTPFPVFVQFVD